MKLIGFFTNNLLFSSGWPVLVFILFLFLLAIFFRYALIVAIPLLIFSLYFFRNPQRECEIKNENALVSPADGKVVAIDTSDKYDLNGFKYRVSIFLSPFDVHVQWIPCDAVVKAVNYRPGKFLMAFAPKSSEVNERNDVRLTCKNGQDIEVRQIAGFIARRICCWVKPEDKVGACTKYGMIRFGSRVDIMLPANVNINVKVGQRVVGAETQIAEWKK